MGKQSLEAEYLAKIGEYHAFYSLEEGENYNFDFDPELQLRKNIALRRGFQGNNYARVWFEEYIVDRYPDKAVEVMGKFDESAKALVYVDRLDEYKYAETVVCSDLHVLDHESILTIIPSNPFNGDGLDEMIHSETSLEFVIEEGRKYWVDQSTSKIKEA